MNQINEQLLTYLRDLVYKKTGIVLTPDKSYLIESRLRPLLRTFEKKDISELLESLRNTPEGKVHQRVTEALLTSETLFFRDDHPFETLRESVLPELIEKRTKERKLSIWSAACSTGQEPYSLAILLLEHFPPLANWDIEILATDLGEANLARAKKGLYCSIQTLSLIHI